MRALVRRWVLYVAVYNICVSLPCRALGPPVYGLLLLATCRSRNNLTQDTMHVHRSWRLCAQDGAPGDGMLAFEMTLAGVTKVWTTCARRGLWSSKAKAKCPSIRE